MAVVYVAEHAVTGERVALKTVESENSGVRSGIRREIHALRRVDHPGVVRIVDQGVEGDLPWYAMEVVEGRTLREYNADLAELDTVGRAAAVTPARDRSSATPHSVDPPRFLRAANGALPQVLGVLRGVCDALSFIHGMGLVHRDLKPENVIIRPDGTPVLVDFGLAMQLRGARGREVLELGDHFIGTPAYMAPEQIDGELMDARVDLYALGCMMYESVTGRVPFGGSLEQILDQQSHVPPQRPSSTVSDVPPALDDLILALLQKRPRDRIGYADDVAAVLMRLGAGSRPPAPRAEPHLYRSRLAGRTSALATLEEKLKNVRVTHGARVFIGGESGVGKTRFALEVGLSANRRGLGIITGECVSVAASVADADVKAASLHPFRHLLSTIADHCRELGLAETERVLGSRGPVLALHEPSIGALPGQDAYPRLAAVSAPAARARLNACLAGTIAAFAATQPLVIVLEDLQWADEASMSFLQSLDDAYFAGARVLVVGTYRSEECDDELRALVHAPDATHIELGRLDAGAVQRMVGDMIAMPVPPAAFLAFLVERSEGHPFFVAEYVRAAVHERILFRNDAGAWQFRPLARDDRSSYEALPLPEEIREMVTRRADALGAGALAAARMASVLGREVDADVLAAAMSLDDDAHLEAVEELRARQIVDVDGGRLRFAHDKLREIIHAAIGEDERRNLHAAAGAALEARYAGTPGMEAYYPDLVHHFTKAHDREKAFEYLVKAGDAALDATASGEALACFRRALTLADGGAPRLDELARAELESRLGNAAFDVGLFPEAELHTRTALHRFRGEPIEHRRSTVRAIADLVREVGPQAIHLLGPTREATDPIERRRIAGAAQAADRLAQIYFFHHDWVGAIRASLLTVNLAGRLGVSLKLVQGYGAIGFGLGLVRLTRLSALYERRARAGATELGDPQGIGWISLLSAVQALTAGRWSEVRASNEVALACAHETQDPRRIASSIVLFAHLVHFTGRPEDALVHYQDLAEVGRKSGSRQTQVWALGGQAECAVALGHVDQAISLFEQRRALAEDYRNDPSELITHGVVAHAHLLRGDRASARRAAEEALHQIDENRLVGFQFYRGYVANAEVLFALWDRATTPQERDDLDRLIRRSCKKMRAYAFLYPVGRSQHLRLQGLLHVQAGHRLRAHRAFTESMLEARRLAMPLEEGIAHHELGRLYAAADPARAVHLASARAIFTALGHHQWLDRTGR